ncbi:CocE/NonD family hydrolase [Actinocorallia sp. A-T 12471]|uniref:CocE/NonD family hydrolase n=1 Tax=Actinocorallia sp. A-T 12471 TaxID=3089813 RepID=UPI0029D06DCA|nr:CocE/NonD family hydrolase [Actinocorallia sp. A-T 12471]MDX6742023.1 CocE/NonD family hydrolase [Actinocorallia sp. A-T 12471]
MAITDRLSVPERLRQFPQLPQLPHIPGLPGLPTLPSATYRVSHIKDIPVPMPDGTMLLADRYVPLGVKNPPTILVRTPYGRRGVTGAINGYPFAFFGYQIVVQSVRGTFGSGGSFDPLNEQIDGLATVEWLKRQPWFHGTFATYGPSYLGHAQWAIAGKAGPEHKAMSLAVTASQFRDAIYIGGSFALESTLGWVSVTSRIEHPLDLFRMRRRTARAVRAGLPLEELDAYTTGGSVPFFQQLLTGHGVPEDPFWDGRVHSAACDGDLPAASMVGGWYDVFLPWMLKDYIAMRSTGQSPQLTIGPWWHADPRHGLAALRESLAWFRAHLKEDPSALRENPVRLFVTGIGEWREYADWPVPGARTQRWHLQAGHGLAKAGPRTSKPDKYRYDPNDPTPAFGGPTLLGIGRPVDQRPAERRPDVLVYTSAELEDDLDVIGPVAAELYVRSSRAHTDFVVRLCDVAPDGSSKNVCEGGLRLTTENFPPDGDGVRKVDLDMWPIAHRFKKGHRVRVHVASGAYPKIASNPGTGEPIGSARTVVAADQEVFHDPDRRSALFLPVMPAS